MKEWFEDDHLWKAMYPVIFPETKIESAEDEVERVLNLLPYTVNNVLDLCCGPGRHSVALAKHGLEVTGVDRTPYLLNIAKETARRENVEVEWILEDMSKFSRPETFDLVVNLFTSFGYYEKHEDNMTVLKRIHKNLSIDGILVMEIMTKEILASIYTGTISFDLDTGGFAVQRVKINNGWDRVHNQWTLVDEKGDAETFTFSHWIYSGQELKRMLLDVGFKEIHLFGSLCGIPYDNDAHRLVLVAYK